MLQYILLMLVFGGLSASASFDERVVGGTNAPSNTVLSMVSIQTEFFVPVCAGTILSETYILTAASCFTGRTPDTMHVQWGRRIISFDGDNTVGIIGVELHPDFDPQEKKHDIAIVTVAAGINLAGNVRVVTLNRDPTFPSSTAKVRVFGWGFEEQGGDIQKTLKYAILDVYPLTECSALHVKQILNTNICARSRVGSKGFCNGDEGGPLMSNDGSKQVGIVSWSEQPCATKSSPGVYTRVSKYICWINHVTQLDL